MADGGRRDPVPAARQKLLDVCGLSEAGVAAIDADVEEEVRDGGGHGDAGAARPQPPPAGVLRRQRPVPARQRRRAAASPVRLPAASQRVEPLPRGSVKNGDAVRLALEYLLEHNPGAFLSGLDMGVYGSAFKTCKGLIERHGAERVIDMPHVRIGLGGVRPGGIAGGRASRSSSSSSPISPPRRPRKSA